MQMQSDRDGGLLKGTSGGSYWQGDIQQASRLPSRFDEQNSRLVLGVFFLSSLVIQADADTAFLMSAINERVFCYDR